MKMLASFPSRFRHGLIALASCAALFSLDPRPAAASSTLTVANPGTSLGSLIVTANAATGATTLNAGTLQLGTSTVTNANAVTIFTGVNSVNATNVVTGGTLTINAGTPVTVAGQLTASGLTINSSIYNAGTLQISAGTNLNGSGTLTLSNAQLATTGTTTIPVQTINGALFLNHQAIGTANAITFTNPISLGFTTTGAGTLVLANNTIYTGPLTMLNGVVLNGTIILDTIVYTSGNPPAGDYGTPTADAPSTGEANVLSNTQAGARGAFLRSSNSLKVRIEYGLDQTYGKIKIATTAAQPGFGTGQPAFFNVTLDWLQPGTTYHYRTKVIETITTTTATGPTTQTVTRYGEDRTFTTSPMLSRGPVWSPGTPITFNAVQLANGLGVILNTTSQIVAVTPGAHGATATDGTNVTYVPNATFANEDAIRVKISFTASGSILFPTPPPAPYVFEVKVQRPAQPEVVTGDAIVGSNSDVQLNATFTANGPNPFAAFDYGTEDTYGSTVNAFTLTGPNGTSIIPSIVLTLLQPGTTYHYRARLQNSLGTALGEDRTFTTPAVVDGGDYLTDTAGVTFNPLGRIVAPWETATTLLANPSATAPFSGALSGSSSSIITIGPGTGAIKVIAGVTQGAHGTTSYTGDSVTYVPGPTFHRQRQLSLPRRRWPHRRGAPQPASDQCSLLGPREHSQPARSRRGPGG